MDIWLGLGICTVLLFVLVKAIDFTIEQLLKFLLVLHLPGRSISIFFRIMGLSVPLLVMSLALLNRGAQRIASGTICGFAILLLLCTLILIGTSKKPKESIAISSQSLTALLFGAMLFALVASDGQITRIEGATLFVACIAYIVTTLKVSATPSLLHKTELSLGRLLGLVSTLALSTAIVLFTSWFATDVATSFFDTALPAATLFGFIFACPVVMLAVKDKHPVVDIDTIAHHGLVAIFGFLGAMAIFSPVVIPFATTMSIFFAVAVVAIFLLARGFLKPSVLTTTLFACLLLLYCVRLLSL